MNLPANSSTQQAGHRSVAWALGLFSVTLGAAEILWPRQLAKFIGAPHGRIAQRIVRGFGLRELAAGVGLLVNDRSPAPWLWARAAGDTLDLAMLGVALGHRSAKAPQLLAAMAAVGGIGALDVVSAWRLDGFPLVLTGKQSVRSACTVNRPLHEVYAFWSKVEHLPQFMTHLDSVEPLAAGRSRWQVRGPAGMRVSWEAEVTRNDADHCIAWSSLPGSDMDNAGEVRFQPAPGDQGTEVRVFLTYAAPAGAAGAAFARLWSAAPDRLVHAELRRFKEIMETGEVLRSDASVHAGMHAAQPPTRGAVKEVLQ